MTTRPDELKPGEALALVRAIEHGPDPIDLFARLAGGDGLRANTLLLESGDTQAPRGEKSLLAVRAALRASCRGRGVCVHALNANGKSLLPWLAKRIEAAGAAKVEGAPDGLTARYPPPPSGDEDRRLRAPSPFDAIRAIVLGLTARSAEASQSPLMAGVFSYDLLEALEPLPPASSDPLGWPDYELWLPDELIWLDHRLGRATIVAHVFGGENAVPAYNDAATEIARLARAVESAPARAADAIHAPAGTSCPMPARVHASAPEPDMDDPAFMALVLKLKHHILLGDVFQIVPSRVFRMPCLDPLAAYRRLRTLNPSPYMFFVNSAAGTLFGASPETAIRVDGSPRRVEIRPIAGTRPRGRRSDGSPDADQDARLEAELRLDDKEVAEHMMLVDLARNDVARVSEPGTRTVDRLLGVDRYSHVMHLVSHVSGALRSDLDALHAYAATMNMGTLVGAPKIEAAKLLRRHETARRGPYGGAVGYLTQDGRLDTAIVIRSAIVRGGIAHVRAGAGVVYASDPRAEADETRRKAEAVLQAIRESASGA